MMLAQHGSLFYTRPRLADYCFKREDLQVVRSYKIRGAYNKMSSLTEQEAANGVVCASAGNHAQGVALSCKLLKIQGTIFMPSTTPNQKIERAKMFGEHFVKIILIGDSFDDAYNAAIKDFQKRFTVVPCGTRPLCWDPLSPPRILAHEVFPTPLGPVNKRA